MKQLPDGQYNFKETEKKILDFWKKKPFFKPEFDPKTGEIQTTEEYKKDDREKWTLICPPPNAYDRPHIGNLSGYSYQDAMARYQRSRGKRVLMVPGKDHAGLEGEATFIRDSLEKQGKKKSDFTREEFYQQVWDHQQKFIGMIREDEQGIGLSADFDRELYTLDPKIVNTVLGTFVDMYGKGLLYKGVRIVNWDVKAQSTIPDNQCVREEREGRLYFIKYPIGSVNGLTGSRVNELNNSNLFITVATTRPETMLGDTALVVNPSDERYARLVGKKALIPIANREIPIITSGRVEKEFGTGVLKCTPAHAQDDWEIMQEWNAMQTFIKTRVDLENRKRKDDPIEDFIDAQLMIDSQNIKVDGHDNPSLIGKEHKKIGYINVIDKGLRMVGPIPEKYKGLKVNAAREAIVADLKEQGFIEKEESLTQNVLVSERTGVVVEPLMTSQWFMDVSGFKKPLRDMVIEEKVKIYPKNLEKRYFSWVDNMRDWAISRNLWWGYRLPVWYSSEVLEEIDENGQVQLKINLSSRTERSGVEGSDSSLSQESQSKSKDQILRQAQDDKVENLVDFDPNNPNHMRVQLDSPGEGWIQDNDILDTWFSSGQWPYAVLEAADLMDSNYPTDALVSATDLLVKWDLTMMLFSWFKTGKEPFKNLFLTGLVKGTDGQKMSKSKKNYVPIDDVKEQYGTDSFRMNCFYQNKAGRSYKISPETLKTFRNFNNKIWNASKFVMMNLEGLQENDFFSELEKIDSAEILLNIKSSILKLEQDDQLMLNKLQILEQEFTQNMDKYRFGKVTEDLYAHFWHEYCDWYIEATKSRVWKDRESGEYKSTPESRLAAQATLYYSLKSYLKMLHPFIPFITEEIWQHLVEDGRYEMAMMYS